MELVKIQNSSNLARDLNSGAVINTNAADYKNYLAKKRVNADLKEQIKQNSDDINELKSDVAEIKNLLISLINKER